MELTTLEMLMLAPLTNRVIQSPTAPDKLKGTIGGRNITAHAVIKR